MPSSEYINIFLEDYIRPEVKNIASVSIVYLIKKLYNDALEYSEVMDEDKRIFLNFVKEVISRLDSKLNIDNNPYDTIFTNNGDETDIISKFSKCIQSFMEIFYDSYNIDEVDYLVCTRIMDSCIVFENHKRENYVLN